MSYKIKVQPLGFEFNADPDEAILDAAMRQGYTLPHGCRNGACGACMGKVLAGEVERSLAESYALNEDELAANMALFCCAKARSDLTIESPQARRSEDIVARNYPARVELIERRAPDVLELRLKLPAAEVFRYHPGQYIDILLKDGQRRSYSLANAPHDSDLLHLHIRHMQGGVFTEQAFGNLKVRDVLRINGPHGTFFLREDSSKPMILLASGTGMAPIKAIVEHLIHLENQRPVHLYWGCRAKVDLYLPDLPLHWASQFPWLSYVPVLSEPRPEDAWTGRSGLVHAAVMADFADLSAHQVYACGVPIMVEAAHRDFVGQCGLPEAEFFSDAFTPSVAKGD